MANQVVSVKIQLENGQYISASNEVVRSTDRMQNEAKKHFVKMDNAAEGLAKTIRRRFGFAALFGAGFAAAFGAISSLIGGISDGIKRAVSNNEQFKTSMQNLQDNINVMFDRIAAWIIPLIDRLVPLINLVGQLGGQNALTQMYTRSEDLNNLKMAIQWQLDNWKMTNKEIEEHKRDIADIDAKLVIVNAREKAILEVEKKKTAELKKQQEEIYSKQFAKQAADIKNSTDAFVSLNKKMLDLIPVEGKVGENFSKISASIVEMQGLFDKIDFSKLKLVFADQINLSMSLLQGIINLGEGIADYVGDQIELNSELEATSPIIDELNGYINNYLDALDGLNQQIRDFNQLVNVESAIRNKTVDDIDREIKAKEDLIKANEDLIKTNDDFTSSTKGVDYEAVLRGLTQSKSETENNIKDLEEKLANDWFTNIFVGGIRRQLLGEARGKLNTLNAQISYYQQLIEARDKGNNAEVENINLQNEIEDLLKERAEMTGEIADAENAITDEMQKQVDLMKQYVDLGLDLENVRTVKQMTKGLAAAGYSGANLGTALQDIGVQNQAISGRTLNIFGDINNTLNQASLNASMQSLNNIINKLGGV